MGNVTQEGPGPLWCGLEAEMVRWPVTLRGVAGLMEETLSPTDRASLSCMEVTLEAPGDPGGPESLGTDGTASPSVPLSTAPPSLLCPRWTGGE